MMAQEEWSNAVFEREEDDGLENNTEEGLQVNDSNAANTNMSEIDAEAHAKFFAQRFKTEWESCLQRATADFDRAMKLFWCEVRPVFHIVDKKIILLSLRHFSSVCVKTHVNDSVFHTPPPLNHFMCVGVCRHERLQTKR